MTATKEKERCPYDDLYIYVLRGVLPSKAEDQLGDEFIGNWVEGDSSFLFFKRPSEEAVLRLLNENPGLGLEESHCFTYEQWQGGGFVRLQAGDFNLIPPWDLTAGKGGGINILLDPGVVFGNGLHPTTRHCLEAIALTNHQETFTSALDLGTGTGVLALAAALLGADRVLAVDINPLCVRTAKRNVKRNGLEARVQVVQGTAEAFATEPVDLVTANIHYEVIKGLLDRETLCNTRRIIVSGLMRSQFREIRERLKKKNFDLIREWDHDMTWFTLLAQK